MDLYMDVKAGGFLGRKWMLVFTRLVGAAHSYEHEIPATAKAMESRGVSFYMLVLLATHLENHGMEGNAGTWLT